MKKIVIILTSIFLVLSTVGQNVDSIFNTTKAMADDSLKVDYINYCSTLSTDDKLILQYSEEAIKIATKLNYKRGIADAYNTLAYVYSSQNDIDQAFTFLNKSLKLRIIIKDSAGIAECLNNLATIHIKRNRYDNAMSMLNSSLEMYEHLGDIQGIAICHRKIGDIYYSTNEYNKAIDKYKLAIVTYKNTKDDQVTLFYYKLAEAYFKLNQVNLAERNAKICLHIALDKDQFKRVCDASKFLDMLYKNRGDYKKAYNMNSVYHRYTDTLHSEETQKLMIKQEYQRMVDAEKAFQERKDVITNQKMHDQTVQRNASFIGFILAMVVIILVFRQYKIKHKQKQLIEKKNKVIEDKQNEILASIRYAQKIQLSLLTSEKYIEKTLNRLNP